MLQRLAVLVCTAGLAVACAQSDAGITTSVKAKLAADDMVKAYEINVDTQNRVVTLTGQVETSVAKDQALKLTRETDGVRDVVDRLTVRETAATSGASYGEDAARRTAEAADKAGAVVTDAALTTAVKTKLLADPTVSGLKIDVDTSQSIVTLTGNVTTSAEAEEAVRLARATEGVRDVVNKLRVTAR